MMKQQLYRVIRLKNCKSKKTKAQKQCIFDPMLVKLKCVWEAVDLFNCQKFVYIYFSAVCLQLFNENNPLKRVLTLST